LLGHQLCNPVLELLYERTAPDRLDLKLINLSVLSLEALGAVLARGSFSVKSEDELLERLLSLGEEYRPLLRWVEMRFLSASGLAALAAHLGSPTEWAWGGFADHRFRFCGGAAATVSMRATSRPLRRPREHSDIDFGHGREHLRRVHAGGLGIAH
jgi:hypothetical protein